MTEDATRDYQDRLSAVVTGALRPGGDLDRQLETLRVACGELRKVHPDYYMATARLEGRRLRIMRKVLERVEYDEETGCWTWTGPTSGDVGRGCNYPRMSLDGQTVAVHRVTFVVAHGFIHNRRQVDHLCKNRLCVSPFHLDAVTHRENQRRKK